MRILHTADWHLGQTFYGYDRSVEHQAFLDWLIEAIGDHQVDALLISGDVFDVANPSAKSQKLLYQFLTQAHGQYPNLQIIITAGNHDSAARLEAPKALLEVLNVSIVGHIPRDEDRNIDYQQMLLPLGKPEQPQAWVLAIPFPRLGDYPSKPEGGTTYTEGVTLLYQEAYQYARETIGSEAPLLAMGHLHAVGASTSENDRSERAIVGGVEFVPATAFNEGLCYTALGHIHRPQRVGKRENIRYSGSPLPMSFTERTYEHQAILIELSQGKISNIQSLPIPIMAQLKQLPLKAAPLAEVLTQLEALPEIEMEGSSDPNCFPYLEVQVALTSPEPSLKQQVIKALESKQARLAKITTVYPKASEAENPQVRSFEDLQALTPQSLFNRIYQKKFGDSPANAIQERFQQILQELE